MNDVPKTRRRWFLFTVRAVFIVVTAIVTLAVIDIEISDFQYKVDTDSLDRLPAAAKAIRPWMIGLKRFSSYALLGAVLCGTYAVFRSTRQECRRLLLVSFLGFLLFVGSVAGNVALFYWVFLPGMAPPRPDFANRPGTLTSLGEQAPDIAVTSVDGPPIRLADLRGRVILVNFFATWCGPCRMELPDLQEIWNEFHDQDAFRMLIIGREESAETVRAFKDEHGFQWPLTRITPRSIALRRKESRAPT